MSAIKFISSHRARFQEIDPFGHLNMTAYLSYYLENRFMGHREVLNQTIADIEKMPFAFHTRKVEIDYIKPVYRDEEFTIESEITEVGNSSCTIHSYMFSQDKELLSKCIFSIVCINKKEKKSQKWPEDFINLFFSPK